MHRTKTAKNGPPLPSAPPQLPRPRHCGEQARTGGLRFEAFLTPDVADWVLEKVENGVFLSPGEAVFVLLDESKELEIHADLRRELLKRRLQVAADVPRPGLSSEEVREELRKLSAAPPPDPALWRK